jgi:hypothetical protein
MTTKFTSIQTEKKGRYEPVDQPKFQRSRVKSVSKTLNLMEVPSEDRGSGIGFRHKIKDYLRKEQGKKTEKDEESEIVYRR